MENGWIKFRLPLKSVTVTLKQSLRTPHAFNMKLFFPRISKNYKDFVMYFYFDEKYVVEIAIA